MKYDVAVVGAGPAGAWVARCLARSGARVAIFDPSHPREKPCGGGVTGRALALVGDAIDARALAQTAIRSAQFMSTACRDEALKARTRACLDEALKARSRVDLSAGSLVVANRTDFD